MSEGKCPKCGADEDWYDMAVRHWSCGSSRNENMKYLSESGECLRRQLAQRDNRIRELEAEVERLKDIIEAMYSCGTRTGVEELYAEYQKEVEGDE